MITTGRLLALLFVLPGEVTYLHAQIALERTVFFDNAPAGDRYGFSEGSVVALMIVGYLADRYFGSSPKGLIIGIVLGSIIGFVQFFRLTSQILKK